MKNLFTKISLLLLGILVIGFVFIDNNPITKFVNTRHEQQVQPITAYTDNPAVYTDDFDGANDTNALKARGYKVWYRGGGPQGLTATWFQGDPVVFSAYNGPTSGYVAANYNVVTNVNNIDSWLVLPRLATGIIAGDTLYFWSRSLVADPYPDSIRVMYSANDSVPEGSWTELGRFQTNITTGWERRGFRAPTTSLNGRFAVRYCVALGGPGGSNSDYIGIDAMTIIRSSSPPTNTYYFSQWCPTATFPVIPSVSIYGAAAVLGDTLYMAIASSDGATTSNLVYRYSIVSHAWSPGTPLPTALAQATLTKCGNKLYHIGGSTAIAGSGVTNTYEYDPATGQWTTKASMPTGKNGHSTVCWGDSVLIVVAGPWGTPDANVYCFRPASNTWATCTSFSGGINVRSQAGGIVGNKIYIAGGYPFTNQLVIGTIGANAQTITWAAGPPFPSVPKSRLGGVGLTDRFYIIGGNNSLGTTSSDSTFVYNVYSNTWTPFASVKPTQVHNVSSVVVAWGTDSIRVACLGGTNNTITAINSFEVIGCGAVFTGIHGRNEIPLVYSLSQNYPNPFNPSTKITYMIPKAGIVKLVVYDILGREVTTLVNELKQAGTYTLEFNASNFASGVYFYSIKSGDFTDTKKMVLIK